MAILQIEYRFQYLLRHSVEERPLPEGLLGKLEMATQSALLDQFGCGSLSRRLASGFESDEQELTLAGGSTRRTEILMQVASEANARLPQNSIRGRRMEQKGPSECDFNVHARVINTIDLGKKRDARANFCSA